MERLSAVRAPGDGRKAPFVALALAAGALAWVGLTAGEPRSALIGGPAALLAALAARRAGARRLAPRALAAPGFGLWLFREILVSAWAVARLLLARDARLAPGIVPYPLGLRSAGARAAFMNAVTLTPGTLSARLAGDRLEVHALKPGPQVTAALRDLEARVARLYGEPPAERPA